MKARYIALGMMIVVALFTTLVWVGSRFFVAYQAAKIAGGRPYCILVSNHDERSNDLYETVSRQSQLSFPHLTAKLENSGGSRGLNYVTNYALLVLDQPREYLNWSFRAMNFVHEPLINIVHGTKNNKPVELTEFTPCMPKSDFVRSLK
jgi:hypothetical protein